MNKYLEEIKFESPKISNILNKSKDLEEAREGLFKYLKDLEWEYRKGIRTSYKLEYSAALESIKVLANYISPWNEKICGFSTLDFLWKLSRDENMETVSVSIDYVEEMKHLLRSIEGNSEVGKGWLSPILEKENIEPIDFNIAKGENAGKLRSDL